MSKIDRISHEIEERREKQRELAARLAAIDDEIKRSRALLGNVFAEGLDEIEGERLRGVIRDLRDERDGLERGLEAVSEQLEALEGERREAEIEEAVAERQRTLDEAEERCESLYETLLDVASERLPPLMPEVRTALAAAEAADQRVQKLTGERDFDVGNRYRDTSYYWAPVVELVERMRAMVEAADEPVGGEPTRRIVTLGSDPVRRLAPP